MFKITDVVRHLLIINIILFLASQFMNLDMLALRYPGSSDFHPYQFVTYFFMHGGFAHILFNMFALVMFGSALEMLWGPRLFLGYYIACALGAALLHILIVYFDVTPLQHALAAFQSNPTSNNLWAFFEHIPSSQLNEEAVRQTSQAIQQGNATAIAQVAQEMQDYLNAKMNVPMLGASGAIFGLLLAFGIKFPNAELMLIFLPIPIKAKYFIPILIVMELFLGVNNFSWDNVAHFAHLGGALTGLILLLFGRYFGAKY